MNLILLPVFLLIVPISRASGYSRSTFFPYGSAYNDTLLPPGDDESYDVPMDPPFPFLDNFWPTMRINIDGVLTFNYTQSAYYIPTCGAGSVPLIAVFWADLVTGPGSIYYRTSTDACLLEQYGLYVAAKYTDVDFHPVSLFIITWDSVTCYRDPSCPSGPTPLNTFQAVLANDGTRSYTSFFYSSITCVTGVYSTENCEEGRHPAEAGFDAGNYVTYMPASDLSCTANVTQLDTTVQQTGGPGFRAPYIPLQPGEISSRVDSVANFGPLAPINRHTVPAPFFPFGLSNLDNVLTSAPDANVLAPLQIPFTLFGLQYDNVLVTNDGVLAFLTDIQVIGSQAPCTPGDVPVIAAYWASADTTTEGTVFYREATDAGTLCRVSRDVWAHFGQLYRPKSVFIATWVELAYANNGEAPTTPGRNTYQIALASDGTTSYAYLMYKELGWTTGCADPAPECGVSTAAPMAGFDPGTGAPLIQLPGSCDSENARTILDGRNVGVIGEYLFQVDSEIVPPEARKRIG